jgi:hypothetical protein
MKKNKSFGLIAIILVIIVLVLLTQNHYSTLKKEETSFAIRDTASISKVFIADKGVNSVLIERTDKGWILDKKHVANTRIVSTLLETIRGLRVKSPVSIASRDNVVRRLATIGKKVEIYQQVYRIEMFGMKLFKHEKLTKVIYVGDVTRDNLGTYMLIEDAANPYVVNMPGFRGFVSSRFSPLTDDWLSHVVFNHQLSDIKSLELVFAEHDSSSYKIDVLDEMGNYSITRLFDQKVLETYDTLKVLNLMTSFADLRYESRLTTILPPQRIDSIVNSPMMYELTLVDNSLDTISVKMFKKNRVSEAVREMYNVLIPVDHDRFYGLINKGEDLVLMQYYVFDKVLYPIEYYR